jgi:hypothetical protein
LYNISQNVYKGGKKMNKLEKFAVYSFMLCVGVFGVGQAVAQEEPQVMTVGAPQVDLKKISQEVIAGVELPDAVKTFVKGLTRDQKSLWDNTVATVIARGDDWCYGLYCTEDDEKKHIARFLYKYYRWVEELSAQVSTDRRKKPVDKKTIITQAYINAYNVFKREHYEKEPSTEQEINRKP